MIAHQAPPSLGFSRQEHCSGLPFPSPMHESEKLSEVSQSCPSLSDPMVFSLPGSSVHGIFQARGLEWGATPGHLLWDLIYCTLNKPRTCLQRSVLKNDGKSDRVPHSAANKCYPCGFMYIRDPLSFCLILSGMHPPQRLFWDMGSHVVYPNGCRYSYTQFSGPPL